MDPGFINEIGREAIYVVIMMSAPVLIPSWNAKKTKPLVHAGDRVPAYVLGVPQI